MKITKTKDFIRLDTESKDGIRTAVDITQNDEFIMADLSLELPYTDGELLLVDNGFQYIYQGSIQRLINQQSLVFNRMRNKKEEKEIIEKIKELSR